MNDVYFSTAFCLISFKVQTSLIVRQINYVFQDSVGHFSASVKSSRQYSWTIIVAICRFIEKMQCLLRSIKSISLVSSLVWFILKLFEMPRHPYISLLYRKLLNCYRKCLDGIPICSFAICRSDENDKFSSSVRLHQDDIHAVRRDWVGQEAKNVKCESSSMLFMKQFRNLLHIILIENWDIFYHTWI